MGKGHFPFFAFPARAFHQMADLEIQLKFVDAHGTAIQTLQPGRGSPSFWRDEKFQVFNKKTPPERRRLFPITTGGIQQEAALTAVCNLWPPPKFVNQLCFLTATRPGVL
jgi:hypothetical protein